MHHRHSDHFFCHRGLTDGVEGETVEGPFLILHSTAQINDDLVSHSAQTIPTTDVIKYMNLSHKYSRTI